MHIAHDNRAVIFGDALDLPDFAQHPSGKAALFVGIGHRDGEGIGQAVHELAHHRGDADMGEHPVNRIRITVHLARRREGVYLHEAATLVLIELLGIRAGKIDGLDGVSHRRVIAPRNGVEHRLRRGEGHRVAEGKGAVGADLQRDVALERKRGHVDAVLRVFAGHRNGCRSTLGRINLEVATAARRTQVDDTRARADVLGRLELHIAVDAQVDVALRVEQFLIVRGGHDKAVMQKEGVRGLIIGCESVAEDVGFISLAHAHAVKPDVVIHRVVNERLTRRNRIAVAVQHPLVQVRFGIHVVEVLVERSEEFPIAPATEVAFTREVRDIRALAFCADVVKARAILGVAALHGNVLALHTGKGRHIVPASILFDA